MKPMALLKSLFYLTKLSAQLGVLFFIYKNRRRKAKNSFKQQIIKAGLSSAEAEELARVYPSFPSIRELMRFSRPES
jgi:hypothetical protein